MAAIGYNFNIILTSAEPSGVTDDFIDMIRCRQSEQSGHHTLSSCVNGML